MLSWGVPACGTMQLSARTGDRFLLQGRCGWEAGVGIVFEAAGQIQVSHGNSRLFCNQRPISGTGTDNWTLVAGRTRIAKRHLNPTWCLENDPNPRLPPTSPLQFKSCGSNLL